MEKEDRRRGMEDIWGLRPRDFRGVGICDWPFPDVKAGLRVEHGSIFEFFPSFSIILRRICQLGQPQSSTPKPPFVSCQGQFSHVFSCHTGDYKGGSIPI